MDDRGYEVSSSERSRLNEILSKKCDLGGEGSSGGFIYPEFNLCRDGVLLALMTTYLVKKFDENSIQLMKVFRMK